VGLRIKHIENQYYRGTIEKSLTFSIVPSILLDTQVQLVSENDFIVQVKFTSPESDYPLPIDYYTASWLPAWSDVATFSGESYYSADASQFRSISSYDLGIRARAVKASSSWDKSDFNCNSVSADADDLAMMKDAFEHKIELL